MNISNFAYMLDDKYSEDKPITVHTGGYNWEEIVDVVFCSECDHYHIISERIQLEGSTKDLSDFIKNIPPA